MHTADYISLCMSCIIFILCIWRVTASHGDRSDVYRACMRWCDNQNCSNEEHFAHFSESRPFHLALLQWDCQDECDYQCMWRTVSAFEKNGHPVPQFHGKWPFIRFFGIQEPASSLFSVFNGLSHFYMWQQFRRNVKNTCPYYGIWNSQGLLSVNAWLWSAVFHARDTPFTEKLDYYCAFSLVLYAFYALFVRALGTSFHSSWVPASVALPFIAYFIYHVHYLSFVNFDYGYNMKANLVVGTLNSLGWLLWCFKKRQNSYVWKCVISVIIINIFLLLELGDFPPMGFVLDAHALWHLGTAPVPFLWYSFLEDDCLYLLSEKKPKQV